MFYCCSNFLTEAPGQYTGPGVGGPGMGLVRQGAGPVMVGQQGPQGQINQARTSKSHLSLIPPSPPP